jgi:hypothetical protein
LQQTFKEYLQNNRKFKVARMKIGTVISPRYNLSSIFFHDYHRVLEDLHRCCNILLAGNIASKPSYADALISLKPQQLSMFFNNRYVIPLSNLSRGFGNARQKLEAVHDEYVFKNIAAFFGKETPDILYLFPRYPDSYHIRLYRQLSSKFVVEFWEDQIEHLCQELETSGVFGKYSSLEKA